MPSADHPLPSWLTLSETTGPGPGAFPASPASGEPRTPRTLDGRACRTRAGLFTETARALDLPDYFGRNWDAFYDCLRDVDSPDLAFDHAEELLIDEPPEQFGSLLDVLSEAGLHVTLTTLHPHELRSRLLAVL